MSSVSNRWLEMRDTDINCDVPGCSNPATVFGILSTGVKPKVCEDHKQGTPMATFSISAFHFIQSTKDIPLYEERRKLMQRGLGNLTTLQKRCEKEWAQGQARIQASRDSFMQVVEKTCQEMSVRGRTGYETAIQRLECTRAQLEKLVQSKAFHLSSDEKALCSAVPSGSPFRVVVGDCRVTIVETLLSNFHLLSTHSEDDWDCLFRTQVQQERIDTAYEISKFANEHGSKLTNLREAARRQEEQTPLQLTELLSSSVSEEEIRKCAAVYLRTAQARVKEGNYDLAKEDLGKGRRLLSARNLRNSELWLESSNVLAEVHHQLEEYISCASVCEEVLGTWERHSHTLQLSRAVFFRACVMDWEITSGQISTSTACSWLAQWTTRFESCNLSYPSVLLYIQAVHFEIQGAFEEATRKYEEGLMLRQLPQTYLTLYCHFRLGDMSAHYMMKFTEGVEQLQLVVTMSALVCPFALPVCRSLLYLGKLYHQPFANIVAADEKYQQACSLLSTRHADHPIYPYCLYFAGSFYRDIDRREEAQRKLTTAYSLCKTSNSFLAGSCEKALADLNRT